MVLNPGHNLPACLSRTYEKLHMILPIKQSMCFTPDHMHLLWDLQPPRIWSRSVAWKQGVHTKNLLWLRSFLTCRRQSAFLAWKSSVPSFPHTIAFFLACLLPREAPRTRTIISQHRTLLPPCDACQACHFFLLIVFSFCHAYRRCDLRVKQMVHDGLPGSVHTYPGG